MTSKNIVDLINRLASVKADASSVYTTAEVNSLTNANRELIEANTQADITNYNSLGDRLNALDTDNTSNKERLTALSNELANYLPLAGGNVTGNLTVQNKNVVRSVNGVNADANGNVTISSLNGYRLIYWETDYFDITTSGLYSFDLTNTDFANISKDAIDVQMVAKIKTAQSGFKVGDYVYPQFANYIGSTANSEQGSTPYISGNVLSIRFGNSSTFVEAGPNGAISELSKTAVKVKIMLTTWIKEV